MVKIVFLDFDNTLFSHDKHCIPESAVEALETLRNKGVKIVISTGRGLCEIKEFNMGSFKYDLLISLNGQIVYDQDDNIISSHPLEGELKDKIIELFNSKTVPMTIKHIDDIYINYHDEFVINKFKHLTSKIPQIKEANLTKDIYMSSVFLGNKESLEKIKPLYELGNVVFWSGDSVDVINKNISKATGIKTILDLYNIKKEEAVSFGDAQNDIDMFLTTGLSIAVGNAPDEVKEKATYVTDDINNDGIAKAIKKYIN